MRALPPWFIYFVQGPPGKRGCMAVPLDVFAVGNFDPEWLGSARTLTHALELIRERGTGAYFVFSEKDLEKTFYKVTQDGSVSSVACP
jgi:hypothetical protein